MAKESAFQCSFQFFDYSGAFLSSAMCIISVFIDKYCITAKTEAMAAYQ